MISETDCALSSQFRFRSGRFRWKRQYPQLTNDIWDVSSSYRSVEYRSGPRDGTPTCVEHSEIRQIYHRAGRQSATIHQDGADKIACTTSDTRTNSDAKNTPAHICIPLYRGWSQVLSADDAIPGRECSNEDRNHLSSTEMPNLQRV
jgi:hypothetical protein